MANRKARQAQAAVRWRASFHAPKGVSAVTAAEELDRIRAARGELTAAAVLDESRPEDAPLHAAFEWDDSKAAEHYRLQQSRQLIKAVVVIEKRVDASEVECSRFHLVSGAARGSTQYLPTEVVAQDVDLFADALRRLEADVVSAQRSVQNLERVAAGVSLEPEKTQRIAAAVKALEAMTVAIAGLH